MKVKIFYPNTNGNIELTKKQLEDLLEEAYDEGYRDSYHFYYNQSITTPSITIGEESTKKDNWWDGNIVYCGSNNVTIDTDAYKINTSNTHSPFVVEMSNTTAANN